MEPYSFGHWLRLKRKALDLTREGLADRVGYSAETIRKVETEERRPSAQLVDQLAALFEIPENQRRDFLRFARGDWQAAPSGNVESPPWLVTRWRKQDDPLKTITHRHNLPVQVTSFIAREREIALVDEYFSREDIRLVTLTGPPGIGKTRLSIETARASLPEFPDGVFFVALAPLDDPRLIPSAIIQALGYMESGANAPEDQLKESIGGKQLLIVLDNCEHLIEEITAIASRLLSACSRLKILATSRESFRIPGEWLYPIPAFDIPKDRDTIDLDSASDFPALLLFAERARAVRPDFKLTAENLQMITAICAHLDGLPLVIELIAARMRLMSPQALLERLSAHFVLTADGMRAPSERQKTLWNAIDWSFNLLSDQEQKLLRYLSVFSGGFTLADAEAIFARSFSEKSVPELLALLLDKSLIQRVASESGEDRYEMLVMIQEYARERLAQSGEETEIRNWHLEYFGELARQARPHLRSTDQLAWLDRLDTEYDNIRAALAWALDGGSVESGLHLASDLGVDTGAFWVHRGHLKEGHELLEQLLLKSQDTAPIETLAAGYGSVAAVEFWLGDRADAQHHAQQSEALWSQLGPSYKAKAAEARVLKIYTESDFSQDPSEVCRQFQENLPIFQETGDRWLMAYTLFGIAYYLRISGDLPGARQTFEQSRTLFQECGDGLHVNQANISLALIAIEEGRYTEARNLCEETLPYFRQLRFSLRDEPLWILGALSIMESNYAAAKAWYTECLLFDQEIGIYDQLPECLIGFASIANSERSFERAAQLIGTAEAAVTARQNPLANFDQAELQRLKMELREELGEAKFEALAAEGRTMTVEQATAYALEDQI